LAVVQGYAVGVGAEMCLNCDFVMMAESAQFGFPEIGIATFVGGGACKTLPRLVGLAKARELIMMCDRVSGAEAARIGLVNRCVTDEHLREEAVAFAKKLAKMAPISVSLAKRIINSDCDYETMPALECEAVLTCMMTEDWQEGVHAFSEKRTPVFKGR
jgi:enoyl-CoA hydratase